MDTESASDPGLRRTSDAGLGGTERGHVGPGFVGLTVNGQSVTAEVGTSVAVALLTHGVTAFRRSVTGEPRAPLCGMGICYECRVTIDGRPHQKSCQVVVAAGMTVVTDV